MSPELKTPQHRRLVRTNTPGIYRRGDRYVAITYHRGNRIKTTHDSKPEARNARARRCAGPAAPSRERFEDYVERWLVEYRGRTAHGLAPSTREAYAWTMRGVDPVSRTCEGFRRPAAKGWCLTCPQPDPRTSMRAASAASPRCRLSSWLLRKAAEGLVVLGAEAGWLLSGKAAPGGVVSLGPFRPL